MCNLYSQTRNVDAIRRLFRVAHNRSVQIDPQDAIFPRHSAPVVRRAEDGEHELITMSWGFVRLEKDKAPKRVTNVRDDKVLISPFWKASFRERRCLVPVTSWSEPGQGNRHWFAVKGNEPRPLFAFAGIWRSCNGPVKKDGPTVSIETYAFMMTPANAVAASINHDRCR